MKSDMPAYKDTPDSSMQKLRSVLMDRGSLDGFSSKIKDAKTATLSEEIVNFIQLQLENYIADNASETVDQVSGRIQAKLDGLGESGVSVSDDAIQKIKDAFAGGGGADERDLEIAQRIIEILNGIGSKISLFKKFLSGDKPAGQSEESDESEKRDLPDQKLFTKFLDEVMPDVTFFDDKLGELQKYLSLKSAVFQNMGIKLAASSAVLVVANVALAASNVALAASNYQISASNSAMAVANIQLAAADMALAGSKLVLSASNIALSTARVALLVSIATFMTGVLTSAMASGGAFIVGLTAAMATAAGALFAASASVSASITGLALTVFVAAASVTGAVFTAAASAAAGLFAAVSAVALASLSAAGSVFASSAAVVSAIVSAGVSTAASMLSAVASIITSAASVASGMASVVVSLAAAAASFVVGVAAGAMGAAAAVGISIVSAAASLAAAVVSGASAVILGAGSLAVSMLAGALAISGTALAMLASGGAVLIASAASAAAIALALAGTAAAIVIATAFTGAAVIMAAAGFFAASLALAVAGIILAITAVALSVAAALAAFTAAFTVLLILIVAIPLAIVWGIKWTFDKIKENIGAVDDASARADAAMSGIDGWMDMFRKNENGERRGFGEILGESLLGLAKTIAKWAMDWPVWKWVGAAYDWIKTMAGRIAAATASYIVDVKNAFVEWWNSLVDGMVDAGKFSILGKDFDLFSGAAGMKMSIEAAPPPPPVGEPQVDQVQMPEDGPAQVEEMMRSRDEDVRENVQQYRDRTAAAQDKENENKMKAVAASGIGLDKELDALLEEATRPADVSTPVVPVRTPGAGRPLEQQEN